MFDAVGHDRLQIRYAGSADRQRWDRYVRHHPDASVFHLFGWRDIIRKTYCHGTYYLMACEDKIGAGGAEQRWETGNVLGVLPLIHLKNVIFGNHLISLPYLDVGGILSSSRAAEERLLAEAIKLGGELGATRIELRHAQPLACWEEIVALCAESSGQPVKYTTKSHKVKMVLPLPESAERLMKSFKSKLRSQINKPLKEGLTSRTGGIELLDNFYKVFLANMRDLGSPVHSVNLMRHVLGEFSEQSKLIVVYRGKLPVASGLVLGFNKTLCNPWASSLKQYAVLSPNMLLYLRMLEYACDQRYQLFDFGRSSPGEGTYKFKEQWGATPVPLHWHFIALNGKPVDADNSEKAMFEKAIRYWKMLPLAVTRIIGPAIRKHVGL